MNKNDLSNVHTSFYNSLETPTLFFLSLRSDQKGVTVLHDLQALTQEFIILQDELCLSFTCFLIKFRVYQMFFINFDNFESYI